MRITHTGERVRALGIPIQWQSGIVANPELEWSMVDDRHLDVATRVGDQRLTMRLEFDDEGDPIGCFAEARPRIVNGISVPTAWGGELGEYRILDGTRMPTRGEVYWQLPEGRLVYWRGEITSALALDQPFGRT